MNAQLINDVLERSWRSALPPGTLHEFTAHPNDPVGRSLEVGVVQEHRFAFWFWTKWMHERLVLKDASPPPHLVTIDYHDDVGAMSDVVPEVLERLDVADETEAALFAWCGLNPKNDGHILPAQYLNSLRDAFVLFKGDDGDDRSGTIRDLKGGEHSFRYFNTVDDLLGALPKDGSPIVLDVDLDYFTTGAGPSGLLPIHKSQPREMRELLGLEGPLMREVLPRTVGVTIALEPAWCGGIRNSLQLLDRLSREWFEGQLQSKQCRWKPR